MGNIYLSTEKLTQIKSDLQKVNGFVNLIDNGKNFKVLTKNNCIEINNTIFNLIDITIKPVNVNCNIITVSNVNACKVDIIELINKQLTIF